MLSVQRGSGRHAVDTCGLLETYSSPKEPQHNLSLSDILFVTVVLNNSNNLGNWKARNLSHILNDYCCHHNHSHKCSYKHWWKCIE